MPCFSPIFVCLHLSGDMCVCVSTRGNRPDLLELSSPVTSLFSVSGVIFLTNIPSLLLLMRQRKRSFCLWLTSFFFWRTFCNPHWLKLIKMCMEAKPPQRERNAETAIYSVGLKASSRSFSKCTVQ